jgi:MSHA pilin protein MshA
MNNKRQLKKRGGFTLIEIIAVLVILGILAAYAVPKYQDLQTEAYNSVAQGAIAAGQSALSMYWAETKLSGGTFACSDASSEVNFDNDKITSVTIADSTDDTKGDCQITVGTSGSSDDQVGYWKSPDWTSP